MTQRRALDLVVTSEPDKQEIRRELTVYHYLPALLLIAHTAATNVAGQA